MQHDFILLDRSQSMISNSKWPEALAAINAYVAGLAASNVDTGVTLATFDKFSADTSFDIIRDRITPTTWHPVSDNDATPRGNTPLNDAIGRIVTLAKAQPYDKVAIIIVTDGEENASTELNRYQAKALLDDCRAKGWQVIFLGAAYDNAAQAKNYGAKDESVVSSSVGNLRSTARHTSTLRANYATTGAAMAFTPEDQKRFAKEDNT